MSWVTAYMLELGEHEVFQPWYVAAPIPFSSKLRLFADLMKPNATPGFEGLPDRISKVQEYRNVVAHSFREHFGIRTSRGLDVTKQLGGLEDMRNRLEEAQKVESLLGSMLYSYLTGPMPLVSADDIADAPL